MAYTLEVASLLVAFGARDLLRDWMMVVDIIIVGCGWAEIIISSAAGNFGFRTAVLRALRLVRIFRLIRLLQLGDGIQMCVSVCVCMYVCAFFVLFFVPFFGGGGSGGVQVLV